MKKHRLLIVFLFLVIWIFIIFSINWFSQDYARLQCYYSGILGSLLASFFAAFLVWVAWEQLGNLGKISSADFIHRLNGEFFTSNTRKLLNLIDCEALEFKQNNQAESGNDSEVQPYFQVNKDKINKTKLPKDLKRSLNKREHYSVWEVDDLLLGHFEDIGRLEQRRIVDFQSVYDVFSWYLESVWDNDAIKEYIQWSRDDDKANRIDQAIYSQFQYIAIKCLEYEELHPGPCLWWWKFRRYFRGPKIEMKVKDKNIN